MVQVARTGVNIATNQECWKENQNPKATRPQTHAGWWIRISKTPQKCWIDPDPSGPRSNGRKHGALDRVRTRPVQRLYKRFFARFLSFSHNVSLSSLFSLLSSLLSLRRSFIFSDETLTLNLQTSLEFHESWLKRFISLF